MLFGCGRLDKLHKQKLPGKKALIVISAGKSMRTQGYLGRVEEQLSKAGVSSAVFDKILPNPIKEHVMEGASLAKAQGCDFILGLGGGSTIDSAKAIAVMAVNDGDYWDYMGSGTGKGLPVPNDPLPVVAITTTAGTGTEADPWSVITNMETKEKIGFGYDRTFPVLSIVDPELMVSVPPALTAFQGFDALFHSIEGYLASIASPVSDIFALETIRRVSRSLARAVADGNDIEAREDVAWGNTSAGYVQSISSCISEHSIEHALSAFHPELPHGAGLIMISKAYFGKLIGKGAVPGRFVDMAKAMGMADAKKPEDFIDALTGLQKDCGVDVLKMSDYGIVPDEFADLAENAKTVMGNLFKLDPVSLSEEDVIEILKDSYR